MLSCKHFVCGYLMCICVGLVREPNAIECSGEGWNCCLQMAEGMRQIRFCLQMIHQYSHVKVAKGSKGMTAKAARQCAKDTKEWRRLVHM